MGEVRRHGSKYWSIRYYRNGRRYEESSRSTKKGDAERLLLNAGGRHRQGGPDVVEDRPASFR